MKHYVVKYGLAYEHIVAVGIRANTPEEAERTAQRLFDDGSIWRDTSDLPLLYDDFEEAENNVLEFKATEVDEWPQPDASVIKERERAAAFDVCRELVRLIRSGDWGEVSLRGLAPVFEKAMVATGVISKPRPADSSAMAVPNTVAFHARGASDAIAVASWLTGLSRWFTMTPLPDDVFEFVVRNEALHQIPKEAVQASVG